MALKFGGSQANTVAKPKIVVFGVGGGGCNAVNHMIQSRVHGVEFIIANTDAQALENSPCENKIQLGSSVTGGLGAGSVPEIGKRAAEESISEIEDYIRDAHMVFVASGMGGGTGTGAAPIIAKVAKERGILTIGVVTKPFSFEREKRMKTAEAGITEMRKYCDTTIVIANQNLFRIASAETTLTDAFKMADNVLVSGIRCVTDLITNSGLINLDFADVSVIMSDMGYAVMGEGEGIGEDRAVRAAENAMTNPLLEESSIKGATGLLINITGGNDITLFEINDIIDRITSEVDPDANIKFGSIIKEDVAGTIKVSIVATGLSSVKQYTQVKVSKNNENVNYHFDIEKEEVDEGENYDNERFAEHGNKHISPEDKEDADEEDSNFGGYEVPEQEERDYFNSFYDKSSSNKFNDIAEMKEKEYKANSFIPKKAVDIGRMQQDAPKPTGKFDIKSIFKINRGS
ncbi:MAG: cell division protein FtsZ [Proteobacteria bacterium]|jgi:cell division protein FtsZ|nr:cell division protein FtsZ [Pseudomonadota bacterium]